jgi:hypothetical protein
VTITPHWMRFWDNGPGIAWKRADQPMLFSQRMGYTRTVTAFGWRFWWLRGMR